MVYRFNSDDRVDYREEVILDSVIILLVVIKLIMRGCCSEKISFGCLVIWIVMEIIIV